MSHAPQPTNHRTAYEALMRELLRRAAARIAYDDKAAGDQPAAVEVPRELDTRHPHP